MKKLLIIGAGIGQVPLLKKAKARGIHVTVASIPGPYPCLDMADDVICMDIYDRDGIVEEAKKRGITAVISDQNDLMMPTVAYVAEKLGLPGNRFDTVMSYCNKNSFRDICDKTGVPCPKHIAVVTTEFASSAFDCPLPWIVKPADSQSSIGIRRIESEKDLKPALEEALSKSPTHAAIVEEFFEGKEIVCEGFINDGKYYLLSLGDRRYFDMKDLMIPSQTLFPADLRKDLHDKIVAYERALTQYTKPSFAIVHSEYLINETTGEIRVVESALRGGGVYISSDLLPLATGIDINDVLLGKALGEEFDINSLFEQRKENASAYVCFYMDEGVICSVNGVQELKSLPFVKAAYIDDIQVGQTTQPPTYKGTRKGPILIQAQSRENLERYIRTIQHTLHVIVQTPSGGMTNIYWE